MDDSRVNFALVLRSDKEGMSIIFGWWRTEVVKHLGKFSHCLIFLRAAACIFLLDDSGIKSTAMTKWKEAQDKSCISTAYIRMYMHLVQIFQFLLENSNELLARFAGFRSI